MQKTNLQNYLHLHLLVFIWGFTAILGALISLEAIPLVWYRMLFASLIILIYFLVTKKSLKIAPKVLLKFLVSGIIIATHWIAFFTAIKVANVSIALVGMSTGAFFASLIEPLFFKRKLNYLELLFGLVVMVGLYLIFGVTKGNYTTGIIYALVAAFLSALFSVLNGLYVKRHDAATISFYQLFFGCSFITLYILATNGFTAAQFALVNNDFIFLFILSSICTAYAFIVSVKIMKYLTPYTVVLTLNLEPVYGIVLAVLFFGDKEKMSPQFYVGAAIILCTVLVNGLAKKYKKRIFLTP